MSVTRSSATQSLTSAVVAGLPVGLHWFKGSLVHGKPCVAGFGVKVSAGGSRMWVYQYRLRGVSRRLSLGQTTVLNVQEAAAAAREAAQDVARGQHPVYRSGPENSPVTSATTLRAIVRAYLAQSGQRTARMRTQLAENHVFPTYGVMQIHDVGRRDLQALVNRVVAKSGPGAARSVTSLLSAAFRWYQKQDPDFTSKLVPGLAPAGRKRERILSDGEIRLLWKATADGSAGSRLVRFLLCTGVRRNEAAFSIGRGVVMLVEAGFAGMALVIPKERSKNGREHSVPWLEHLAALAPLPNRLDDLIFQGTKNFSRLKTRLDDALREAAANAPPIPHWTLHDLRRSFASLCQRAGVPPEVREACLNHQIPGTAGVYARYPYLKERADALKKVHDLILEIVAAGAKTDVAGQVVAKIREMLDRGTLA